MFSCRCRAAWRPARSTRAPARRRRSWRRSAPASARRRQVAPRPRPSRCASRCAVGVIERRRPTGCRPAKARQRSPSTGAPISARPRVQRFDLNADRQPGGRRGRLRRRGAGGGGRCPRHLQPGGLSRSMLACLATSRYGCQSRSTSSAISQAPWSSRSSSRSKCSAFGQPGQPCVTTAPPVSCRSGPHEQSRRTGVRPSAARAGTHSAGSNTSATRSCLSARIRTPARCRYRPRTHRRLRCLFSGTAMSARIGPIGV